MPDVWNTSLIQIKDGKRDTTDFVDDCIKLSWVKEIKTNNSMETIINELKLNNENIGNTMTVYEDSQFNIQFCYQQDYLEEHEITDITPQYNYFASLLNNTVDTIFGTTIFFKIDIINNIIVNLPACELFDLLANLHFIKTFQVRNGDLCEITLPNLPNKINDMTKDMQVHNIDKWKFFMPKDSPGDITDIGVELVDINKYNGLIFLLGKPDNELTNKYINEQTVRGSYFDLSESYIKKFFI